MHPERAAGDGPTMAPVSTLFRRPLLAAVVLLALGPASQAWAANDDDGDRESIERFAQDCQPAAYLPEDNVGFGPVRKSSGDPNDPTFRRYEMASSELKFAKDTYRRHLGYQLRFYSGVKPTVDSPKYVWHVLSLPREVNSRTSANNSWDGMILEVAGFSNITSLDPAVSQKHRKAKQYSSMPIGSRGYAVNNAAVGVASRVEVNAIWKEIFGDTTMSMLVFRSGSWRDEIKDGFESGKYASSARKVVYDHVFFFMPLHRIGSGDEVFFVSSRDMNTPGRAYGFVLDPSGQCVGSSFVDLEP